MCFFPLLGQGLDPALEPLLTPTSGRERDMATAAAAAKAGPKEITFIYEGKDKAGKQVRGEIRSAGENMAQAALRRQGIIVSSFKKQKTGRGGAGCARGVARVTAA